MAQIKTLHQWLWSAEHTNAQSILRDKIETGEISEIEAEYLDDVDNMRQSMALLSFDFAIQN